MVTDIEYMPTADVPRKKLMIKKSNLLFKFQRILLFGWMPPHPTVYIKREFLEEIGEYDENFKISFEAFQVKFKAIFVRFFMWSADRNIKIRKLESR